MDIFQVIILSIIEGVTEFIPVSSTGHLLIFQKFMGWNIPFGFDLFIQMGSFLAAVIYFRKRIFNISTAFVKKYLLGKVKETKLSEEENLNANFALGLAVATVPIVLIAMIFSDAIEIYLHNGLTISILLIAFSFVMFYFDSMPKLNKDLENLNFSNMIKIGIWQVLAVLPGVSRSGATITGALSLGFKRDAAAEVSFLLGIPVIVAGGLKGIYEMVKNKGAEQVEYFQLSLGFTISFLIGLFAIHFMMKYLKKNNNRLFIYYRLIIGTVFLIYFLGKL